MTDRGRVLALLLALCSSRAARAEETEPQQQPSTEVGAVPFAGGDSDHGVAIGLLSAIERRAPPLYPYEWRLEGTALLSFKPGRGDELVALPYQDFALKFSWVRSERWRLLLHVGYVRESFLKYSGLGNAAPEPDASRSPTGQEEYFEWAWLHPHMAIGALLTLGHLRVESRLFYSYNWFTIPAQSQLRQDAEDPDFTPPLVGLGPHGRLLGELEVGFDSRDHEVNPQTGQFHQLEFRFTPIKGAISPYQHGEITLTLRGYVSPIRDRLTFAARAQADFLFGDVPFYMLSRIGETFAFGGPNALRGVPAQRYYGMVKVLTGLELRASVVSFSVFGKHCTFGAATFADVGRLWASYARSPELDGTAAGLKLGLGAGPRLYVGDVLVVRGDIAWSPDAHPVSGYFLAGHSF